MTGDEADREGAQPAAKPKVAVKPTVHGAKKGEDRVYWNISHPTSEVWRNVFSILYLTTRAENVSTSSFTDEVKGTVTADLWGLINQNVKDVNR